MMKQQPVPGSKIIQGFVSVPPIEALLYTVFEVHSTIGPQLVQFHPPLSAVVAPGALLHAGCPFPVNPICVVFGAVTGSALTLTNWKRYSVEVAVSLTLIIPIVENSVLATHCCAADPVSVITTGGTPGEPTIVYVCAGFVKF
jgi:hypothetical protein